MSNRKHWRDAIDKWSGQLDFTFEHMPLAVLMSIREELQTLNRVFACRNVQEGFSALRRIAKLNETDFKRRVDSAVRKRLARRK